ncbi:Bifunctional NAD(P)H-hydrate repair enzyme Nnr [Rhodobacteraceae bacterium THAF1]|nr:Bifunctional NAD(P)H-hydrate repair enzyme Nnr [Palleronia sp. THAF1]VDC28963.1 Bifunctional NAD(P)H-hydrate repair enzyme Nnr [Rhodobacteraceae bacterium THAF1]
MTELLTAEQMREIERAAIESGKVTGLELMERAGQGAVEAIFAEWPELREGSHRAVVLCGPGNNGGDGFVVARLLKEREWDIEVFLYGDAPADGSDASTMQHQWEQHGSVLSIGDSYGPDDNHEPVALLIDAVFGVGLNRKLEGADLTDFLPWHLLHGQGRRRLHDDKRVVAIDIPTGLCSDSGKLLAKDGMVADLTVTFHTQKRGHVLANGPETCGSVRVVDIGLPHLPRIPPTLLYQENSNWGATIFLDTDGDRFTKDKAIVRQVGNPEWLMKIGRHKFDHGHALVLSGGVGRGGAARLAARGGLRIGAGLVTVACPPAALIENAVQLNAIMLRSVTDGDALAAMLEDARLNALCLGPGLGTGPREAGLVWAALGARRRIVLDGDALTLLANNADLMALLHVDCVLTPHEGEFARLFPDLSERLSEDNTYSKVDATRNAAARAGCVIVFKGPDTVIATPDGRAAIHAAAYDRAAPWLATAGSGDVLAGFVTGLLARDFTPFDAACTAAWLHTECALKFGPGLIAEDLPEILPQVLRAL